MFMKKLMLATLIAAPTLANADDVANMFFSNSNPELTAQERAAINIGKQWQQGQGDAIRPVRGADGAINWTYLNGRMYPVVCAVLQVCDIALEPGEQVKGDLNIGDPRFVVTPAVVGSGPLQVMHLMVKPMDVGVDTTMDVATDRRMYHFRLRSARNDMMPFVSFTYPEEAMAKWQLAQQEAVKERQQNTLPATGEYLGNLNFGYDIEGTAKWKPVRVYNDGRKTVIEMPDTLSQDEAPTLLVVRKDGGLFSDDETQMVNYRLQNNRYIVDSVVDKVILIAGVGSSQDKVTITKEGK